MSNYISPNLNLILDEIVLVNGKLQSAYVVNGNWYLSRDRQHFTARTGSSGYVVNRWVAEDFPIYKTPSGIGDYNDQFAWFEGLTETERESYRVLDQDINERAVYAAPKDPDDEPAF